MVSGKECLPQTEEELSTEGEPRAASSFPSKIRLRRLVEKEVVHAVFRDGQKSISGFFAVFSLRKQSGAPGYAIHIKKRYGIAVERNHAKRLLRAALYQLREIIRDYHVILIPRRKMKALRFWQIVWELEQVFSEAGIAKKT